MGNAVVAVHVEHSLVGDGRFKRSESPGALMAASGKWTFSPFY